MILMFGIKVGGSVRVKLRVQVRVQVMVQGKGDCEGARLRVSDRVRVGMDQAATFFLGEELVGTANDL